VAVGDAALPAELDESFASALVRLRRRQRCGWARPQRGLVQATNGDFYGTTGFGGTRPLYGMVFTPNGALTTLYSFCPQSKQIGHRGNLDALAALDRLRHVGQSPSPRTAPSPSVFYALSLSVVAGNDAPLIGECAGRRRRSALEGGDERASLKSALLVRAPDSRTGANVRSLTRGDHWTDGSASAHSHCSQPP
jgi:hypothetical protein